MERGWAPVVNYVPGALIKYIIISTTPGGGVGDLINGRQVMKLTPRQVK